MTDTLTTAETAEILDALFPAGSWAHRMTTNNADNDTEIRTLAGRIYRTMRKRAERADDEGRGLYGSILYTRAIAYRALTGERRDGADARKVEYRLAGIWRCVDNAITQLSLLGATPERLIKIRDLLGEIRELFWDTPDLAMDACRKNGGPLDQAAALASELAL